MRYLFMLPMALISSVAFADSADLTAAVENARASCIGISSDMNHLKMMAGINTAVTSVGTVTGGVALGTGVAKSMYDQSIDVYTATLNRIKEAQEKDPNIKFTLITTDDIKEATADEYKAALQTDIDNFTTKSQNLGNARTGTLAASTAANIAGATIAGLNRVDVDLQERIAKCLADVKALSGVYMQERTNVDVDEEQLAQVQKILSNCDDWEYVDLDAINKRSTGALASSSVGAGTGLVGTITSAIGNTKLKADATDKDKNTHRNLNVTANVMAGGTTVASAVATVFNATQISAIKRAVDVADRCEGALK